MQGWKKILIGVVTGSLITLVFFSLLLHFLVFPNTTYSCQSGVHFEEKFVLAVITAISIGSFIGGFISNSLNRGTIAGLFMGIIDYFGVLLIFSLNSQTTSVLASQQYCQNIIPLLPTWVTFVQKYIVAFPFGIILCIVIGFIGGVIGSFVVKRLNEK